MLNSASGSAEVDMTLKIDEETMAALVEESTLMGDGDVEDAIRRRLQQGIGIAEIMGPRDLRLRPVHRGAFSFKLSLDLALADDLGLLADKWGYDRDVIVATILFDDLCKPFDVIVRERQVAPALEREVRREPGKGNIYPVELQMPGYQLVFVRMLAGFFPDRALVLEEALLALARNIVRGEPVLGAPVSPEALTFAQRMVAFAPRQAMRSWRAWP